MKRDGNLVKPFQHPTHLFGEDFFEYFPSAIRPLQALIIGGRGSRSFLHADPYEWNGWNYLVEGKKICTLVETSQFMMLYFNKCLQCNFQGHSSHPTSRLLSFVPKETLLMLGENTIFQQVKT